MKKIAHLLFGRFALVAVSIIVQFAWLFTVFVQLSYKSTYVNLFIRMIAVIVVLRIVNRWNNPINKLSWTFIILLSPMFGLLLYAIFGRANLTKGNQKKMDRAIREVSKYLYQTAEVTQGIQGEDKTAYRQSKYINDWAGFPLYKNTETMYYKSGEEMFPAMLEDLKSAKHFIFLEFFIIDNGYMFGEIEKILEEKVKEGVDVRLIYDDVGCITTLPANYYKTLQEKGIKCAAFNPFKPVMSVIMNNRDHRKIVVVDGKVGYTGGINLADEYINKVERFGYWKDTGVRLEGEAVWSLTAMFLQMWTYIVGPSKDFTKYMPSVYQTKPFVSDGYVQPYGDSPLDHENVAENIYMNIINNANDYVYIFTPYLILDHEMMTALCNAAKRGVDIRIVTPGIPDKKMVYLITQSYYPPLLEAGVKIYQYRPGFIHAKSFVCDDKIATVGSVNLDFRSLYLHFECGVYMYKTKAIMQIKEDCREVFAASDEITLYFCKKTNFVVRTVQGVMRLFAPLL